MNTEIFTDLVVKKLEDKLENFVNIMKYIRTHKSKNYEAEIVEGYSVNKDRWVFVFSYKGTYSIWELCQQEKVKEIGEPFWFSPLHSGSDKLLNPVVEELVKEYNIENW